MKQKDRYSIEGMSEGEYEPGSRSRVLKNLLSIKSKREIDLLEYHGLNKTLTESFEIFNSGHKFTSANLCDLHKYWLSDIYSWAGSYRQVNMSKDDFPFAAAHLIPSLMKKFEKTELDQYTPCNFTDRDDVIKALAVVHVEFILIHPFREGNGRMGRLLASIMAAQAGLPPLDFGGITGKKKRAYFYAVQKGLDKNYDPMKEVFNSVVNKTLKNYK